MTTRPHENRQAELTAMVNEALETGSLLNIEDVLNDLVTSAYDMGYKDALEYGKYVEYEAHKVYVWTCPICEAMCKDPLPELEPMWECKECKTVYSDRDDAKKCCAVPPLGY